MIGRDENKEGERIEQVLKLLELSPKNMELAESYLDLSAPEHQDFTELELNTQRSVYDTLAVFKRTKQELAVRFIRFTAEVGGMTARRLLVYYGWNNDFKYLESILSEVQSVGFYADWVAWTTSAQKELSLQPLIEKGKKDPEIFLKIRELCWDENACNTEMFLAGMYLHCVKPLEESRSLLWAPVGENEDDRAEGNPEHIREMRELLEQRLKVNASGLFDKIHEPEGEEDEKLRAFVQDSDPREEFPYEMRALISGRTRHDYRMCFLPCLAFLGIEHSNRYISLIRFAVAVDGDTVPNLALDACQKIGQAWFQRHIEALEKYLWIPEKTYIRWAILRRESMILERMTVKAPEVVCEAIKNASIEDYGYVLNHMKSGNPAYYEEVGQALKEEYRRIAADQEVKGYTPAEDRARDYLLGIIELDDILPYVEQWRGLHIYDRQKTDRIHSYMQYDQMQLYRRALVLECLRLQEAYFKQYWVEDGLPELDEPWWNRHKNMDRRQIEGMLRLLEAEGFETVQAYSGTEAIRLLNQENPDLILMDLLLPELCGEELLWKIRHELRCNVPVLVLTARGALKEKMDMLKAGADDYITKPFEPEEVIARIDAVLGRDGKDDQGVITYKNIELWPESRKVAVGGKELALTSREYDLLYLFVRYPERVFSRERLYELVWEGGYYGENNTVNVHVSNLRRKLREANSGEEYVQTVYGIGFQLK